MSQDLSAIEGAMANYFSANHNDELDWVSDDRSRQEHGRYLVAMWLGMEKEEAYGWTK